MHEPATLTAPVKADPIEVGFQTPHDDDNARLAKQQPTAPAEQTSQRRALITTRVGLLFMITTVFAVALAFATRLVPELNAIQSFLWFAMITASAIVGMIAMRTVRTLRAIESEIRRVTGHPDQWRSVRPIIGDDSITEGWNQLLDQLHQATPQAEPDRQPAALDQEVVTLARAMRGLPIAWVITDREGRVNYISAAACGVFGISEEASQAGRDLLQLLGLRAEGDSDEASTRERLLSNLHMVNERRTLILENRQMHIRIQRSILNGRSGDGQGLAWVLTDITQQEIASKARDQFLMTATHELRTPLGNLQAYAEALQAEDHLEVDLQKEFCNIIVSEAHRLGRLVDQLLTVGQMEAGSMVANRNELEMLPMVEYATDQMRAMADKKAQQLLTDFAPKLPTIFGDREKLQAALVNLVGNAVKYTPDSGEVIVRCSCDDDWVRIDVQDNGPGIPPDEQQKVFDKFFRGSGAVDSDERGNGLGLAFTREVVRMHGGEVDFQSKIGEGSTFTMRLPVGGQSRSGI